MKTFYLSMSISFQILQKKIIFRKVWVEVLLKYHSFILWLFVLNFQDLNKFFDSMKQCVYMRYKKRTKNLKILYGLNAILLYYMNFDSHYIRAILPTYMEKFAFVKYLKIHSPSLLYMRKLFNIYLLILFVFTRQ